MQKILTKKTLQVRHGNTSLGVGHVVLQRQHKTNDRWNGPTPHEPASQDSHVVLGEAQPSFIHPPTLVGRNYFPI
jgi:hypothetical protein